MHLVVFSYVSSESGSACAENAPIEVSLILSKFQHFSDIFNTKQCCIFTCTVSCGLWNQYTKISCLIILMLLWFSLDGWLKHVTLLGNCLTCFKQRLFKQHDIYIYIYIYI